MDGDDMRTMARGFVITGVLLVPMTASAEVRCRSGVKLTPLEVAPVTLRFRDTSIRVLFDVIQTVTGTQFRVPVGLDYNVTFDMRNVSACRALEIIGASQSITYRQDGDTVVVVPPAPAPSPLAPSAQP